MAFLKLLLHILLIIGKVLLILLLVILALLVLLLCAPFCYRAQVRKDAETLSARGGVSWLWIVLRARFSYIDQKADYEVYFLGIPVLRLIRRIRSKRKPRDGGGQEAAGQTAPEEPPGLQEAAGQTGAMSAKDRPLSAGSAETETGIAQTDKSAGTEPETAAAVQTAVVETDPVTRAGMPEAEANSGTDTESAVLRSGTEEVTDRAAEQPGCPEAAEQLCESTERTASGQQRSDAQHKRKQSIAQRIAGKYRRAAANRRRAKRRRAAAKRRRDALRQAARQQRTEERQAARQQRTGQRQAAQLQRQEKKRSRQANREQRRQERRGRPGLFARLQSACTKLKEIWKLLRSDMFRESLAVVKMRGLKIARHVMPRRIRGYLRFGFDDPATTGQVCGVLALLYPKFPRGLRIMPEFQEACLEADLDIRGHVVLLYLLIQGLKIILNRNVRKLIRRIRNRKKDSQVGGTRHGKS